MLDPSLFLSARTLAVVEAAWDAGELDGVRVPTSFVTAIRDGRLRGRSLEYFAGRRDDRPDLRSLDAFLREHVTDQGVEIRWPSDSFAARVRKLAKDDLVSEVLGEEWTFLTSESWLASRIKRPFSAYVRAGAVAVEFGRHVFDQLIREGERLGDGARNVIEAALRRTLKSDKIPGPLTPPQKFRAVCKWVAVGGSSASTLIQPLAGTLLTAASGFFLLLDP